MDRLTEKDEQGNWCLKGVPWKNLHEGQVITRELWERLYGALWKLMEYENTGLKPEEVDELKDFCRNPLNTAVPVLQYEENCRWIPVEERLPEDDNYILLSFANFSLPLVGRYEADQEGGAFYLGDCDGEDTCISENLFVNAWMPLPEPYRGNEENCVLMEEQDEEHRCYTNCKRGRFD